jgi:hypothetical protein
MVMHINEIFKQEVIEEGDIFAFEINDVLLETHVIGFTDDGDVIVAGDNVILNYLSKNSLCEDVDYDEYNNEEDMVKTNLHTIIRVSSHLENAIEEDENIPEWVQEKIAQVKGMIVGVMDYMISQHEQGNIDFNENIAEAKYHGREVSLGKPMAGDVKKSKVYVKGPKGNVVKVNFGDKKMRIKKSNPKRRKSFRARHNCKNPGPRWKARYWSCRAW